jgi:DNA polymerase-3 subunit gamma/tau
VRSLRAEAPATAVVEVPRVPEAPPPAPPAAESPAAEPVGVAGAAAESAEWFELVTSLGLSGVARMIAEHSELLARDGAVYRLRLDDAHDTLLADGPVAALERALSGRTGEAVRVRVEVGRVVGETPAARLARERLERQQAAEALLQSDRTVQQLLSEFDGRIEGVSPVE